MSNLFQDLGKLKHFLTRRDKRKLALLFGLMLCGSLLEGIGIAAVPVFVSLLMRPSSLSENRWVGEWFPLLPDEPSMEVVFWASLGLLSFVLVKNVFLAFVFYVQARVVAFQQVRLSDRMFRAYQSAPYEWHLQRSSAELLRNIKDDTAQVLKEVMIPVLDLLMAVIMGVVIVAVLVASTPAPALVGILITGVGLFTVVRVFQSIMRRMGGILREQLKSITKAVQQAFGAIVDARVLGCESFFTRVHKAALIKQARATTTSLTIRKASPYIIETISIFGLLVILVLLVATSDSLEEIVPVLSLVGVATLRLKQLASKIAASLHRINAGRAFIPGIERDFDELSAFEASQKRLAIGERKASDAFGAFRALHLANVTYSFPGTELPTVKDVSIEVSRGECIALVGASGSGKSTLANLILGLLEPQAGQVLVNGVRVGEHALEWRSSISYVQQSVYLIDDTIRANVAFGVPPEEVDDDRVREALRASGLEDFVESLDDGVATTVGERGVRLSGGQRQRIGIARAVYPGREVLVMDEATSALDNQTEREVMEAIQALKHQRTLILIAHRLSTVRHCDRLYYVKDGGIESVGTFDELRRSTPAFARMAVGGAL